MSYSYLLTKAIASAAIDFVLPSVRKLAEGKVLKRNQFHIVVASRGFSPDFEASILAEHSENRSAWEFPFGEIARQKCKMSWTSGLSTREIHQLHPQLLLAGDTVYYGSVVCPGNVVACSGVEAYFDEMISTWVQAACNALCHRGREALQATNKDAFIT
ncbi:MAG: hypothetical protein ABL890_02655 [Candidatus Peribacteraceae bacterium]